MKVKKFRIGLGMLSGSLTEWGSSKAGNDLQKLIDLMEGYDDLSVDAFCKKARQGLEAKPLPRAQKTNPVRQEIVDVYISKLRNTIPDEFLFKEIVNEIKKDKQVRVSETKAIASGFMEVDPISSKKSDLLAEIITKRAQNLRTDHKLKILSKW